MDQVGERAWFVAEPLLNPDGKDLVAILAALLRVREFTQRLKQLDTALERHASTTMASDDVIVPGYRALRRGGVWRWGHFDDGLVLREAADWMMTDEETGEFLGEQPAMELFRRVRRLARLEWRVRPLREAGVDLARVATRVPDRHRLTVHRWLDGEGA